jgi:hypothetical protein
MMLGYLVCEAPEHEAFGQRKETCRECTKVTSVGRAQLIELVEALQIENSAFRKRNIEQVNEIGKLREQIESLASGIYLRGWWCICDSFNGEEKETRMECRSCGEPKKVRTWPPKNSF